MTSRRSSPSNSRPVSVAAKRRRLAQKAARSRTGRLASAESFNMVGMPTGTPFTVERIDHLVLNVADLEASAEWYGRVLGMRREIAEGRTIMWFGEQKLHLRPVDAGQEEWFTGRHPAPGSDDLCFATEVDIDDIAVHLASCGVEVEVGPVQRAGARGTMTSVYCRDPDGSLIEISTYR
jgi:catechol 2,3-dioxygenase-like lactoylglutathione lyase family enzyme